MKERRTERRKDITAGRKVGRSCGCLGCYVMLDGSKYGITGGSEEGRKEDEGRKENDAKR
jgi:hypothetical protein